MAFYAEAEIWKLQKQLASLEKEMEAIKQLVEETRKGLGLPPTPKEPPKINAMPSDHPQFIRVTVKKRGSE